MRPRGLSGKEYWRSRRATRTGAIRCLRKADYPKALGVAYYLAGQHILFREQMAEAIRRDPTDFGPYYYLGRHYDSDVDNAEEAARWLRLALERNEGFATARSHLGNCLERLGRTSEAEAEYKASSGVAQSQVGLARLRLAAGDARLALTFIRKAIEVDSRDVSALKLAARIYGTLDRPRESVGRLNRQRFWRRGTPPSGISWPAHINRSATPRGPVPHCASLNDSVPSMVRSRAGDHKNECCDPAATTNAQALCSTHGHNAGPRPAYE